MAETLMRHIDLLKEIPRAPSRKSAEQLLARLQNLGYQTTLRSVQRDLQQLAQQFTTLEQDTRNKPYGWCWARDSKEFTLAGMPPSVALSFQLAKRFLEPLFPRNQFEALETHFKQAEEVLKNHHSTHLKSWTDKVMILPRGMPLFSLPLAPQVIEQVYEALLNQNYLTLAYTKRGATTAKIYHLLMPLGIVYRESVSYLIAQQSEAPFALRQFNLNRIEQSEVQTECFDYPTDFSLQAFVAQGNLGFLLAPKPLKLTIRMNEMDAVHLMENTLSADQKIKRTPQGVEISATLADTSELRFWLKGYGARIEILAPAALRQEWADEALRLSALYS
jgi:predicted DNA-binding transcriptional regulator YafY